MQSLIPSLETYMPSFQIESYYKLLNKLETPERNDHHLTPQIIQSNLSLIRTALSKLKADFIKTIFNSDADEIIFFKITKPHFHSLLTYWNTILDLELHWPLGGKKTEEKYLRKHLRKIHWFFEQHSEFYAYYRGGKTFMDSIYFKRNLEPPTYSTFPHVLEVDLNYSTEKDWLVAKMLGCERMQIYLEHSLVRLHSKTAIASQLSGKTSLLRWTASKANLVELIYALHSAGVYNNGSADLKAIANQFEELFQVELGNFYHVFNELRLRKINRTQLLDTLKDKVLRKMDELDEKR